MHIRNTGRWFALSLFLATGLAGYASAAQDPPPTEGTSAAAPGPEVRSMKLPGGQQQWFGTHPDLRLEIDHSRPAFKFSGSERRWLAEHPELRLGIDPSWPPFEFLDARGAYSGIAAGIVEEVRTLLGVDMAPVEGLSWTEVMDRVKRGEIDVIPMITPSAEREKFLVFTKPYISFPAVIVTRRDALYVGGMDDLQGQTVGVVENYIWHEILMREHPDLALRTAATVADTLHMLERREVDAVVVNLAAATYTIHNEGLGDLTVAAPTGYSNDLAMGVRKDWPQLARILDKALASISEGRKQEIKNQWIDIQYEFGLDTRTVFRWGGAIAGGLLLIIVLVLLWNRRLDDEIAERKAAEEALRRSEERFQLAVDAASDGLWDWNIATGEVYHSPRYLAMLGYAPDAFPHRLETFERLAHPDDLQRVNEIMGRHLQHGPDAYDFELRMRTVDGDYRWIHSRGKIVARDPDGSPLRAVGTHTDITDRRREEEKFRALFNYSSETHLILNQSGILDCNQAAVELFGFPDKAALIGLQPPSLSPEEQPDGRASVDKGAEMIAKAFDEGYNRFDWIHRKVNGDTFPVEVTLSPIVLNEDTVLLGVLHDLTARKRVEEEMLRARQLAEEANVAKGQFLANMSHEIRTPMNAVIGMTHLALRTELNPKQRSYLEKIDTASHALLQIVNDILDFSKIEAGRLDLEAIEFYLEDVLDNLAGLIGLKAHDKGLELLFSVDPDVPAALSGDPLRLGQILLNLVTNAIKFTERGEVVVSVQSIEQDADSVRLRFSVRDTGIGLSKEQMARLFQSFTQADGSTTRKYGGTGLGLAISKRLVEMMDGEIWVDSTEGEGSTFSFTAGLGVQAAPQRKPRMEATAELRGMRALVVDDNPTSRDILRGILGSMSIEAGLVPSGEEAIAELENAAADHPYDIVLMDWKMHGIDGVEAASRIKSSPRIGKKPAIILVTAYGREEVMEDEEHGALDGYLIKPVSSSVLFDSLIEALGVSEPEPVVAATRRGHAAQPAGSARGARLLLVEDNAINQEVAVEILSQAGLVPTVADNGREALTILEQDSFDGVLMDVQMPEMDGYEATRAIRDKQEWQGLPIIAMTANAMAGDREKCLDAGMNDYVSKPIDPDELLATIERWVKPEQTVKMPATARAVDEAGESALEIPGFDVEAGLQRVRHNRTLYVKLLHDFADSHADDMAAIRAALDAGDRELAQRLAHTVKGAAGNLGATNLQAAAVEVDALLKDREVAAVDLTGPVQEMERALHGAVGAVRACVPAAPSAPAAGEATAHLPDERVRALAASLREAADIGDLMTVRSLGEALPADVALRGEIITLADAFDLDGVLALAGRIESEAGSGH